MFRPASSVRWVEVDRFVVILDIRRASFLVLNAVAARLWRCLVAGEACDQVASALVRTYGIDGDRASRDVQAFLNECLADGLLVPAAAASKMRDGGSADRSAAPELHRWLPRDVSAWLCLRRAARALKNLPLREVYARYETLPRSADAAPAPALAPLIRSYLRGESVFPSRRAPDDCLPRSLALFEYLLGQGVGATHIVGVELSPFSSHAWVEVDGAPVLDSVRTTRRFAVIARLSPAAAAAC